VQDSPGHILVSKIATFMPVHNGISVIAGFTYLARILRSWATSYMPNMLGRGEGLSRGNGCRTVFLADIQHGYLPTCNTRGEWTGAK
jgi:hypothetical protein